MTMISFTSSLLVIILICNLTLTDSQLLQDPAYPVDFYTFLNQIGNASSTSSISYSKYDSDPTLFGNFRLHCVGTPNYTISPKDTYAIYGSLPSDDFELLRYSAAGIVAITAQCLFRLIAPYDMILRLQFSMGSSASCDYGSSISKRLSTQNAVALKAWDNSDFTSLLMSAPYLKAANYCNSIEVYSKTNQISVAIIYSDARILLPNRDANFTLLVTAIDPRSLTDSDSSLAFLQTTAIYIVLGVVAFFVVLTVILRIFLYPRRRALRRYMFQHGYCLCCFAHLNSRHEPRVRPIVADFNAYTPGTAAVISMSTHSAPKMSAVHMELREQIALYSKMPSAKGSGNLATTIKVEDVDNTMQLEVPAKSAVRLQPTTPSPRRASSLTPSPSPTPIRTPTPLTIPSAETASSRMYSHRRSSIASPRSPVINDPFVVITPD